MAHSPSEKYLKVNLINVKVFGLYLHELGKLQGPKPSKCRCLTQDDSWSQGYFLEGSHANVRCKSKVNILKVHFQYYIILHYLSATIQSTFNLLRIFSLLKYPKYQSQSTLFLNAQQENLLPRYSATYSLHPTKKKPSLL